jgi:hypothetical protein
MLQRRVLRLEKRMRFDRVCDLQNELFTRAIRKQKVLIALTWQRLRARSQAKELISNFDSRLDVEARSVFQKGHLSFITDYTD